MHVPLTALADRAAFDERTREALARAARYGWSTAILAVDIDGFSDINARFGHAAGDEVLVEVARRLELAVSVGDAGPAPSHLVARLGADEFLVLCEKVEGTEAAGAIAARISAAFEEPLDLVPVSVGIGIAVVPPEGAKGGGAILDAEAALRRAKAGGAGRAVVFAEAMRVESRDRRERSEDLRRALDAGQFLVHYQPKILLANDRVAGIEALVRWEHPSKGLIPPDRFIPLAEETGLIVDLGAWVLEEACRQARERLARFPLCPSLVVSVNVSARQFQPALVDTVAGVLARTDMAASSLCLEVTESIVMADIDSTIAILGQLKSLGVGLSIDDFGTGYSSLSHLRRFPLDELKIDRSFVDGLGRNPEDTAIVAAVIAMAHALELRVVAEGVETLEQLERLRTLGCEEVQGYYFSRPLPHDALEEFLIGHDDVWARRHAATSDDQGNHHAEVVVIADDSPEVRQLAAVSLSASGFDVHQADNGRTALELVHVVAPICVVLDVRMPGMDGLEVCRAMRADSTLDDCTIVMLTSNAEAADKVQAFSAGADDYIVKPFAPRDLVGRVRAAVRRRQHA